jgi:peptidoglycan hydrolase CwlO-like protein
VRARRQTLRLVALASLAAVLVSIALPAAGTSARGVKSADSLRAQQTRLQQRSHDALLQLYAIETRLQQARAQLSELDRQKIQLEHERTALRANLKLARRTIAVTKRSLAARARAFYESGEYDNDPVAIILGADSIGAALDRLEAIDRIASEQSAILRQARGARARLLRLRANLARRESELDRVRATAAANAQSLEAARSDKVDTIHRLSSDRALTSKALASLSTQATKAAKKSVKVESRAENATASPTESTTAPETSSGDSTSAPSEPVGGPLHSGEKLTVSATCYCLTGSTASGLPVGPGIMATDPSVIPLGTRASVPGYGVAVAADTGSAVRGLTIDLWVADCAKAAAFGRQTLTITIL